MSLYQQIRKYVDRVAEMPPAPALHAVIDNCRPPYSLHAWKRLLDYAGTFPGVKIQVSRRTVVFPNGHRIKIASLIRPASLRGCRFCTILVTETITQEQREELASHMMFQKTPQEAPAPRPVFGL